MKYVSKIFFTVVIGLLFYSNLLAQGYYFGRNKIQYHDFKWHILKTHHFDIYYYPEMEELAKIGAQYAEDAYSYLENRMNHSVNRRIPLILYSSHFHFQQTNVLPNYLPEGVGGFFEHMKGRVVVPGKGSLSDFKRVITHELVHVFMFSKVNRVIKDHRTRLRTSPPFWFTEGLADYWSGEWDTQAEMVLRDIVISNTIVPLDRISSISGTYLAYKEGESILRYIEHEYGPEKVLMLMENFWRSDKFSKVVEFTIGKNYKELSDDWIYYLKKKYFPLFKQNDTPKMSAERITKKGYNNSPVIYEKNGKKTVVFVSNRTGYTDICSMDLKQNGRKESNFNVLIKGERSEDFESFHYMKSRIDVNKEGVLAFISRSGATDALYTYDISKKKIILKKHLDSIVGMSSPQWSADREKIAFSGIDISGKRDIYVYDIKRNKLIRLTKDFYEDRYPTWAPDNRTIAFGSDRNDHGGETYFNLFTIDIRTGKLAKLTSGSYNDQTPNWSKNGKYIAFLSDREKVNNIWIMKVGKKEAAGDTGNDSDKPTEYYPEEEKQVTHFLTSAYDPAWIDDTGMVFSAFENFSFNIQCRENVLAGFEKPVKDIALDQSNDLIKEWKVRKIMTASAEKASKYKRKYSLDIAQGQVGQDPLYGTSGGAQVVVTDMLGDDQAYFLLYNNAQVKDDFLRSFNFVINRLSIFRKKVLGYGVYQFTGRRYLITDYEYDERLYGGFATLRYPISFFRRVEFTLNLNRSDRQYYSSNLRRKAIQVSGFASYVWDNSAWGVTGPIDGSRYNVTIGHTHDVLWDNVNYFTFYADYRRYFRLTSRTTFAVRAMTHINNGKDARRQYFGGSWDLRLYKRFGLWGEKIAFASTELRFPFIDLLGIKFPFFGLGFSRIRGALFLDAGNAWDKEFDDVLGSTGAGLRLNLGGFLVLRYDVGKRIEDNFTKLSRKTYRQFFFGWDF